VARQGGEETSPSGEEAGRTSRFAHRET
jgi:hypothetical protein